MDNYTTTFGANLLTAYNVFLLSFFCPLIQSTTAGTMQGNYRAITRLGCFSNVCTLMSDIKSEYHSHYMQAIESAACPDIQLINCLLL